jgi:tRNA pseudouridine38-40 synthase
VSRSSNPGRDSRVHGSRFTVLRNLKLTIEYDGTNYVGWQRQAKGVSIQGLLEDALAPFEGGRVVLHGAGRTDAGVHALGQVASAVTSATHDVSTLQRALNVALPRDVRILSIENAAPGFHARFDAISKSYEYRIVNAPFASAFEYRYVWHVPGTLDVDAMRAGAAAFLGRHDFAAFQAGGGHARSTIRTILSIAVDPDPGGPSSLVLRVTGDGFLRHMVRAIAGTLVDIGLARWPASHVETILAGRDRTKAGRAAPACGLFLVEVHYATGPN